jgi:hypothetical protein
MGYDPKGTVTRRHFLGYRPTGKYDPAPLHVESANPEANWFPLPRPMRTMGAPGPDLIVGGVPYTSLGIDPTDPKTWEGRGYRQCSGMMGRFNSPNDWGGEVGASGVRSA